MCLRATVVLKRHPCRTGLKWASLPISPWASAFCQDTAAENEARKIRDRQFRCCRPLKKLTHGLGKKECWYFLLFPKRHRETGQGVCRIITFLSTLPSMGGIFLRDGGSRSACPGFSVLRFRREFLSRMRTLKGNRARMHGLARCGMDAA